MKHAQTGDILPRRQDCPKDAFISLLDLVDIYKHCKTKPGQAKYKRLPIVAISHCWSTRFHPDPHGVTLRIIARKLEEFLPMCAKYGVADVGVFLDWASLYQQPFTSGCSEYTAFRASLSRINLWFAHSLTTVWCVTETEKEVVPYHNRGWTSFEYQISWLIKLADRFNVWPQVVDLGRERRRPCPPEPLAFHLGHEFGSKVFTNGSDQFFVAVKFQQTCEDVYGSAVVLDFDSVSWGNTEVDAFGKVLPLCQKLETLYMGYNNFQRLPESIGELKALRKLFLTGCTSLSSLPDGLAGIPIDEINVRGCNALRSLSRPPSCLVALKAAGCRVICDD
jgi:hypothetical protein